MLPCIPLTPYDGKRDPLNRIIPTCRPRIRALQHEHLCIDDIDKIPAGEVAQDAHLPQPETDVKDLVCGVDRFVDVEGVRGSCGAYGQSVSYGGRQGYTGLCEGRINVRQ